MNIFLWDPLGDDPKDLLVAKHSTNACWKVWSLPTVYKTSQVTQEMATKLTSTENLEFNFSFLEIPLFEQGRVAILNIPNYCISLQKITAPQNAFHLLYDVVLKFGKPEIISFDKRSGFVGNMVAWIIEPENILRKTSAPYRAQSMGLVQRGNQSMGLSPFAHYTIPITLRLEQCSKICVLLRLLWIPSRTQSFWYAFFINSSTSRRWDGWVCWKKKRIVGGHVWNHKKQLL